jgi:hypothetical protein
MERQELYVRGSRFQIRSLSKIIAHQNREAPLVAPRLIMLRHQRRLCVSLLCIALEPVVDCTDGRHGRDAEFAEAANGVYPNMRSRWSIHLPDKPSA